MAVIAITREIGTRGMDVAVELGERLQLDVINDELIEHDVAMRAGMPEQTVHRIFDGTATLLERWRTDNQRLSESTAEKIFQLASKGNVVLRGWGAPYLLRDMPHVMCVRVCAPSPMREQVLVERGLAPDTAAARRWIERQDAANDGVMRKLFGSDGKDASNYSIILNTARLSVATCVEQIASLAASPAFQETPKSQRVLLDRLVLLRVRAALDERFGVDHRFTRLDATVADGRVTLSGQALYEEVNEVAVSLLQGMEGVTDVESRIVVLPFYRRHAA